MIIISTILSLFIFSCNNAQEANVSPVEGANVLIDVPEPIAGVDIITIPELVESQKANGSAEEPKVEEIGEKVVGAETKKEVKVLATKKENIIKDSEEKLEEELVIEIPEILAEAKVEDVEIVGENKEFETTAVIEEIVEVKLSIVKPDHTNLMLC